MAEIVSTDNSPPLLVMSGISKSFGPVSALTNVSVALNAGEVHCIVGENGAGKSTLMNALYGFNPPDAGSIEIEGRQVDIDAPGTALSLGIGMVHQHLMLVPGLTVLQNIVLGLKLKSRTARTAVRDKIAGLTAGMGVSLALDALVGTMPLGQRQQVEILKALVRDARIVILDEPTSVLSPIEIDKLGSIMRALAANGTAIVLITHKLREAIAFSDRLTVMRAGRVVSSGPIADYSHADIVRDMFGASSAAVAASRSGGASLEKSAVRLSVTGLSTRNDQGQTAVDTVSFKLTRGEILGIAGVSGNGQSQLCEALAGTRPHSGSIVLDNRQLKGLSPRDRREAGLAYIPEERSDGLAMQLSVGENLYLNRFDTAGFSTLGVVNRGELEAEARQVGQRFAVPQERMMSPTRLLSGGNQQRIALAKALQTTPGFVIASQPTIGLDLKTIEFVQTALLGLRDRGAGILYVSSELDELFALADRIAVMYGGRFVRIVERKDFSRRTLGPLMISGKDLAA